MAGSKKKQNKNMGGFDGCHGGRDVMHFQISRISLDQKKKRKSINKQNKTKTCRATTTPLLTSTTDFDFYHFFLLQRRPLILTSGY